MPAPPVPSATRVVIIGAGAIGSHLAASLRKNTRVLIIDPCPHTRAAFAARGVEAISPAEIGEWGVADVVVLATSASVAARAVTHVPKSIPVICLANGLIPVLSTTRNGSLSHGVVEFAVHCSEPGIAMRTRDGWLTLQRDSPEDATQRLAAALDPQLQRVRFTDHIDAHRHSKLMLNSSLDPVAAAIGGTIGDVFRATESFRAFRTLLGESLRVARAAGWRLTAIQGVRPDLLHAIFRTPGIGALAARSAAKQAATVSSTLAREVARGELGEADHLSGAIIREGARLGVPTPAHMRAMDVLRRIAAHGGSEGSGGAGARGGRPGLARELLQR